MHPILFEIGVLRVHVYGLMYAIGFLLGLWVVRHESKRLGLDVDRLTDLFFYVLIAATVGSRIFYVVVEEPSMLRHPLDVFKLWQGGLTFYGGLIASVLTGIYYCHKHKFPFVRVADVYAPAISIGHALGRVGCFFAGCCYGKTCPTNAWYAVMFPESPDAIAPAHLPLYPTQLMESFGEFIIFAMLMLFRRKKTFDGQVFLLYVILYGIMRSTVEILRGDESRGYVIPGILSTSQFVSALVIIVAIGVWIWRSKTRSAKQ